MKLGKVAVTGGVKEVFIYITKQMMHKIAARLNEKYSIKSKAATWGKKVVNRAKARFPHTPLSLPATRLVDTLYLSASSPNESSPKGSTEVPRGV
ncbi:hypothetical protein NDI85_20795 [Halomicroarcula sp. S1AR25-4]|uniref:hypothetical protein n=1 Tax=Haloarcula sp. S1AR25-4 TaxID=2950538 RepID=UPI00287712AF|nr:hypothetical protein [Halomicroarcula sp. S1AR25-4]MDS0280227.1 hypothetical protein [Halomicroarcula sp. S1AR25-4]